MARWLCALAFLSVGPLVWATEPTTAPAVHDPPSLALQFIYFPPQTFKNVRRLAGADYALYTNAPEPDDKTLKAHLDAVAAYLDTLPLNPKAPATRPTTTSQPTQRPVVAALYATRDQYKDLWRRVGLYYDGMILGASGAGGYSYRVFCATYMDAAKPRSIPPELCHEFTHVWLTQHAGVPNRGGWLSEGLASAVQMRMFPEAADRKAWAARASVGKYVPLQRLLSVGRIGSQRYWQACTLAEMLLAEQPDKMPDLIKAVRAGRSAYAITTQVLNTTPSELEACWLARLARSAETPAAPAEKPTK